MNTQNEESSQEVRQLKLIAALYTKRSKFREAESVYKAVLVIQEKYLGEFSPELALTYYQLAEVYSDLNQYVQARPLYEKAVHIWEKLGALGMIKPQETIYFMDSMVALQLASEHEQAHHEAVEQRKKRSAA